MSEFNFEDLFAANTPDPMGPSQRRQSATKVKYEFGTAFADPDTIPLEGLWQGLRSGLEKEGRDLTRYSDIMGDPELRQIISTHIKTHRGIDSPIEHIMLGSGSGRMNNLILELLLNPGDIVITEDFAYLGTLRQIRRFKGNIIGVPVDHKGMDTDKLEETLKNLRKTGKTPKLIYTIPSYQNPQGMNLSLERRMRMLELSEEYGVPILEDDVYADLRIEGDLPDAIRSKDESGRTLYVGSFSKIVGPGVRLGYAVLPESVLGRVLALKLDGAPNLLASLAVREYMASHMDEHIENINSSISVKRDAMLSALGEHFPPSCTWSRPEGSLYTWLKLPEGVDVTTFQEEAESKGIRYISGNAFSGSGEGKNCLRLCYGYNSPDEIRDGIALLSDVFSRGKSW